MADKDKKKKFVVEEVVGEEPVSSQELEKETENKLEEESEAKEPEESKEETKTEEVEVLAEAQHSTQESSEESKMETETTPVEPESVSDLETSETTQTPEVEQPKKTNMKLVIVLTAFIALILGGVAGGVLVFISSSSTQTENSEPSPSPIATVAPTETPAPEVDKQSHTIVIQNGSGIAGEGGRMSTLLNEEGFKVGTVGNASSFDHEETIIQAKSGVSEAFIGALTEALSETYVVGESEDLPASSSNDIVVIVGSEKAE